MMQKYFKTQRLAAGIYTGIVIIVFIYTLCFMTEYKDLFGLKLKQNDQISFFHDYILQIFNKQIFTFAVFGVLVILLSFLLEVFGKIPDKFALIIMELSLLLCCACTVYALLNLQAIESYYAGLDFKYLGLESVSDYKPHFTTFRIGTGIYISYIFSCVYYIVAIGRSHIKFQKNRKKGSTRNE
ncbi:hypothetical protein [Lacrimispora defluvii]|uniref:ABC-2 family transporter n=1 Tax=Lacrimispora defluvii TaxID=2719233 RepID=A0ABX1VT34_9FIRM|nr:hypothetical protein [Lacrimispora defluvii]NNJ30997.1 hypothetical protein [Lacrimispora defluvii]